jgi:hypothetical protein
MRTTLTFLPPKVRLFFGLCKGYGNSLSIKYTSLWGKSAYSSRESACRPAGRQPCTHLAASTAQPQNYENTPGDGGQSPQRGCRGRAPADAMDIQKEPSIPGGSLFYLILKCV